MKFIVQDIPIPWDFVMELYRSQEYYKWKGNNFDVIKFGSILPDNPREYCPVGSVEFVVDWLKTYWGKNPIPINCPDLLSGGQIHLPTPLIPKDEIKRSYPDNSEFYIKSERTIKSDINGLYTISDPRLGIPFQDPVVVRPWISNIVSEWRLFVKDGRLLDVKNYTGDPFCCPQKELCNQLCNQCYLLIKAPAFTLDIGVVIEDDMQHHVVIEVHDFFSCGTYGFSNYQSYPIMLWRWFKWFTRDEK